MKRNDLRIVKMFGDRSVTPEEFAEIATAEGYVKLDVDVEALRETAQRWEKVRDGKIPKPIAPIIELIRQVLAALDGEEA